MSSSYFTMPYGSEGVANRKSGKNRLDMIDVISLYVDEPIVGLDFKESTVLNL